MAENKESMLLNKGNMGEDFDKKTPISECTDLEFLRNAVQKLWVIIDDIDAYSDMAKGDDKFYRNRVERRQRDRFELDIASNGYTLLVL